MKTTVSLVLGNTASCFMVVCALALSVPAQIFLQAETMGLNNYSVENTPFASGGKCIKVKKDAIGTATWTFNGPDGAYDLKVWYFNEKDGQSPFAVFANNTQVDSWVADHRSCSDVPAQCNLKSRSKCGIQIKNGSQIKLQGSYRAPGEFARFDCVYLNAAPTVSAPVADPSHILTGATSTLSVQAADDGGEANLKYTWRKISGPGNATFSRQRSNAAKNTDVRLDIAGAYVFVADVQDQGFRHSYPIHGIEPAKKTTSAPVTVTVSAVNQPPTVAMQAFAASNPVTGTSTIVSVRGADDGGEANLVYTWDAAGNPLEPVMFGANGTNAAKTTTVSFAKAGTYALRATIKDAQGLFATSTVSVVVQQAMTTISIKPGFERILINSTQRFIATADSDQFGDPMLSQPSFAWSVSGGGTIDGNGVFSANNIVGGPYTVTASGEFASALAGVSVCNDSFDAFSRIRADSFSTMSGITTEPCSQGGFNVTGIHSGDYLVFYNVNFGAGASIFCAQVAAGASGGAMELRLDDSAAPINGVCPVLVTGGMQSWSIAGCAIQGATGKHTLYVKCTGSGTDELFNLNYIHFTVVTDVAAGDVSSFFLTADSTVWAQGSNEYGQLGDATTVNRRSPVLVMSGVTAVSSGDAHSLFLKTDHTLWACGDNSYGQFGNGTTVSSNTPVQVMSGVLAMKAGGLRSSLILKTDSTLWACGDNEIGQCGDGTTDNHYVPVQIMSNVKSLAKGQSWHNLVLKSDGTLWAFGNNWFGQFGDGTFNDSYIPVQIMSDVRAMAGGWAHTLMVKTDSTLWACGYNATGACGDGTGVDANTPVRIMTGVKDVSAGADVSIIHKHDGTIWSCGDNSSGALGDGTFDYRLEPVQVLSGARSMDAGRVHSVVLKSDGSLWGFGDNYFGQLGGTMPTWTKPNPIAVHP